MEYENCTALLHTTQIMPRDVCDAERECKRLHEHPNMKFVLLTIASIVSFIGVLCNGTLIWLFVNISKVSLMFHENGLTVVCCIQSIPDQSQYAFDCEL